MLRRGRRSEDLHSDISLDGGPRMGALRRVATVLAQYVCVCVLWYFGMATMGKMAVQDNIIATKFTPNGNGFRSRRNFPVLLPRRSLRKVLVVVVVVVVTETIRMTDSGHESKTLE